MLHVQSFHKFYHTGSIQQKRRIRRPNCDICPDRLLMFQIINPTIILDLIGTSNYAVRTCMNTLRQIDCQDALTAGLYCLSSQQYVAVYVS
jgi:hypothetical protein